MFINYMSVMRTSVCAFSRLHSWMLTSSSQGLRNDFKDAFDKLDQEYLDQLAKQEVCVCVCVCVCTCVRACVCVCVCVSVCQSKIIQLRRLQISHRTSTGTLLCPKLISFFSSYFLFTNSHVVVSALSFWFDETGCAMCQAARKSMPGQ